jgi:hypothetical protein
MVKKNANIPVYEKPLSKYKNNKKAKTLLCQNSHLAMYLNPNKDTQIFLYKNSKLIFFSCINLRFSYYIAKEKKDFVEH